MDPLKQPQKRNRFSRQKAMETAAVYWEPRIKTYGFQVFRNLSLVEMEGRPDRLSGWAETIRYFTGTGLQFAVVWVQPSLNSRLCLYLVLDKGGKKIPAASLETLFPEREGESVTITSPVEAIHFQGPHFGDRYGIAQQTFRILKNGGVSVLASVCSSASIYLVLPSKRAEKAKALLEEAFIIPKRRTPLQGPSRRPPGAADEP
ncbi:MAG: hypothetical protein JRH13_11755 [Deltaproteobacteria bacterium]|nr:hypothetical protein [Deltaproteobacteria bacterium]MBW2017101.1 hypothetical protein [Deltaproteobacteria bacterium]MBW2130026.1 hypothetical protein [Deltaproteobacteria bacterium]MBW2302988.1 hypothetical protein [Deltaproteobacteria bacterium]